jgi:hypothetical protein
VLLISSWTNFFDLLLSSPNIRTVATFSMVYQLSSCYDSALHSDDGTSKYIKFSLCLPLLISTLTLNPSMRVPAKVFLEKTDTTVCNVQLLIVY